MLILTNLASIRHAIACYSAHVPVRILKRYAALIETEPIAWLYIIQPGDSASDLATVRQRPFECWEFIERSLGHFLVTIVLSDDGFGHLIVVPDQPGIDATLLTICRNNAEQSEDQ